MLESFAKQLRSKLDFRSRKLDLADLYSRLLMDWLEPANSTAPESSTQGGTPSEDSFEIVEGDRLQLLRENFAAVEFTPLETDEVDIDTYLSELFSRDAGEKALNRLRNSVREKSFEDTNVFNQRSFR